MFRACKCDLEIDTQDPIAVVNSDFDSADAWVVYQPNYAKSPGCVSVGFPCGPPVIKYVWQLANITGNAAIDGPANQSTVKIKHQKRVVASFILKVDVTVLCTTKVGVVNTHVDVSAVRSKTDSGSDQLLSDLLAGARQVLNIKAHSWDAFFFWSWRGVIPPTLKRRSKNVQLL